MYVGWVVGAGGWQGGERGGGDLEQKVPNNKERCNLKTTAE